MHLPAGSIRWPRVIRRRDLHHAPRSYRARRSLKHAKHEAHGRSTMAHRYCSPRSVMPNRHRWTGFSCILMRTTSRPVSSTAPGQISPTWSRPRLRTASCSSSPAAPRHPLASRDGTSDRTGANCLVLRSPTLTSLPESREKNRPDIRNRRSHHQQSAPNQPFTKQIPGAVRERF